MASNEYYKSNTTASNALYVFNRLMNNFLYQVNESLREVKERQPKIKITSAFWRGISLN